MLVYISRLLNIAWVVVVVVVVAAIARLSLNETTDDDDDDLPDFATTSLSD